MNKQSSLILFLFSALLLSNVNALPRFALQQKDKCSGCHINPTGGTIRNENGFFFGKNVVSMISPRDEDFKLSPKISPSLTYGFDYRTQYLYSGESKRSDFQEMTGSMYLSAALSQKIDVVARYDFVNRIWEGYGIAKILPNDSYIKAGSFVPYYGIRLDDHTAYTRGGDYGLLFSKGIAQGLIYNPLYMEAGVELGANITDNVLVTASVGKPKAHSLFSLDPSYTLRMECNHTIDKVQLMFGASAANFKTDNFTSVLNSNMYGGFAGIGFKRLSLMGEYDIANDYMESGAKTTALMIEASYQLIIGLDAVVRYDRLDTGLTTGDTKFSHVVLGFEFFPYSFIELRPQYRINTAGDTSSNAFVLQFHFWY
jgi:hypothetical protein